MQTYAPRDEALGSSNLPLIGIDLQRLVIHPFVKCTAYHCMVPIHYKPSEFSDCHFIPDCSVVQANRSCQFVYLTVLCLFPFGAIHIYIYIYIYIFLFF